MSIFTVAELREGLIMKVRTFSSVALLAALIALLVSCDKGSSTKDESPDSTAVAVCDSSTWERAGAPGVCDSLLFETFLAETKWIGDSVPRLLRENWRDIDHNYKGVKQLSPRISELHWVRSVLISLSDSLFELPPEIYGLPRLHGLSFRNLNNLHSIPNLTHNTPLYYFGLQEMPSLDSLPSGLWLADIHTLEIVASSMGSLPTWLPKMDSLEFLRISLTDFQQIPGNIINVPNLEDFRFNDNQIRSLPDNICEAKFKMEYGGNQLCNLPAEMAACIASKTYSYSDTIQNCN